MQNSCTQCQNPFEVTDNDRAFYDKVSPEFAGKKYLIPDPALCPDCRQQRRLSWRNERSLYKSTCGLCKKSIITSYSPDKDFTVYCRDCWWGDGWDDSSYGRSYDFNRSFFDQFRDLVRVVPKSALLCINVENCEYSNYQNDSRNCYLTFGSGFQEDCMYTNWCYYGKNQVDCSFCSKSELDYENVDCYETYNCHFCTDCHSLTNCTHCFDCRSCRDCFGCVGLRNKQYHIFNKAYSKEDYEETIKNYLRPSRKLFVVDQVKSLRLAHPHLFSRIVNSENCIGDDIYNSQNCSDCFGIKDCQDCKYCADAFEYKDGMDCNRTGICELVYEICGGGYHHRVTFTAICSYLKFSQYSFDCHNGQYLFGCTGLKQKKYCILNKQYSKEDYEILVPRIIEHMKSTLEYGEFFPINLSPFAYNETLAQDEYPLKESEVIEKGWRWKEIVDEPLKVDKTIPAGRLPDDIAEVPDEILAWAIECESGKRPFRIIPQELAFYRSQKLPIPHFHPDERYKRRNGLRRPRRLWDRSCDSCQKSVRSTFSSECPEKVYCDRCYLKEVY